jgi:hypothetical protein
MNKASRHLLILIVVLAGVGIFIWQVVLTRRSTIQAKSPDARYVATVRSTFPLFPLFGGYNYNIEIRSSDGSVVRHLILYDKIIGWGRDPSITWTANSRTVTVGLQDGDTDGKSPIASKRLSVDVQ